MSIRIVVDSTFGVTKEYAAEKNIKVVPLNVIIEGKAYKDEIEISLDEIINKVTEGIKVSTSQPSPELYINAFNELKSEGATDILCFTISSTLSGTLQAANIAKEEIEGVNIHIIDTLTCSIGAEIILREAINYINKGLSIKEVLEKVELLKSNSTILLNMENLNALKISGRITKIKAAIGNLIRVKPILEYIGGKLNVISKFRTESSVYKYMAERLKEETSHIKTKVHVFVSYVRDVDRALRLKKQIELENSNLIVNIGFEVSSVVAVNIGYGGVGLAWCYE